MKIDLEYLDRVDEKRAAELAELEETIGYEFKDKNLLNRSLSHKSHTNERGYEHNEQQEKLEFLGDGVLGVLLNEYLFKTFPGEEEGYLAKIKSAVGSEPALADIAVDLDLGKYSLMGRGEDHVGGRERPGFLADTFEALLGALYIDGGLAAARRFALSYLTDKIEAVASGKEHADHKSLFQEWVQKERHTRPVYRVQRARGPEHSKEFHVSVTVNGKSIAIGRGKSKKEAEQEAARLAYEKLKEGKEKKSASGRGRDTGRRRDRAPRGERAEGSEQEPVAREAGETRGEGRGRSSGRGGRRGRDAGPGRGRGGRGRGEHERGRGRGRERGAPDQGRPRRQGPPPAKRVEEYLPPPDTNDIIAWAIEERIRK